MEQLLNEIRVAYLDADINARLASIPDEARDAALSIGYTQGEELFFELARDLNIPRFTIHHDIRQSEPGAAYIAALKDVVVQLIELIPSSLKGLTYYFDPAEILKPCFFRLYKVEEAVYLFHLRVDLAQRPFEGEVLEPGSNDLTAGYRTRRLYVESEIIPLDAVMWELGRVKAFRIRQLVSNTWIGETGRGYMVRGIWMDSGLSRFFTRLLLPEGTKIYPYFPLFCKYKTICAACPNPGARWRRVLLPVLHRGIGFLSPEMGKIQNALKTGDFSESMPEFQELRARLPASWREPFRGMGTEAYISDREKKEFRLALPD